MNKKAHPASLAGWTLVITVAIGLILAVLAEPPASARFGAPSAEISVDTNARGGHPASMSACTDCPAPPRTHADGLEPDIHPMLAEHAQPTVGLVRVPGPGWGSTQPLAPTAPLHP